MSNNPRSRKNKSPQHKMSVDVDQQPQGKPPSTANNADAEKTSTIQGTAAEPQDFNLGTRSNGPSSTNSNAVKPEPENSTASLPDSTLSTNTHLLSLLATSGSIADTSNSTSNPQTLTVFPITTTATNTGSASFLNALNVINNANGRGSPTTQTNSMSQNLVSLQNPAFSFLPTNAQGPNDIMNVLRLIVRYFLRFSDFYHNLLICPLLINPNETIQDPFSVDSLAQRISLIDPTCPNMAKI